MISKLMIFSSLPEPLISSTIVVPFIKIYREHLAEIFVVPLHEFGSFEVSTG
jgi:hypothetical protein